MWSSVTGRIDATVAGWVRDLVNGLYSFLHLVFTAEGRAWADLVHTALWVGRDLTSFFGSVYRKLFQIIRQTIPAIITEYRRLVDAATKFIQSVLSYVISEIARVTRYIDSLINGAINWVIVHVYDPLARDIATAWQWITTSGRKVLYYIEHPDALAELIFDAMIAVLEREAWTVADKLGRFFLALVAKNMLRFAALIEDILDAIL